MNKINEQNVSLRFFQLAKNSKGSSSAHRFLVTSHTGLGNFILKTPMLKSIINEFPDAKIDIIGGGPDKAELAVKNAEFIGHIYSFNREWSFYKKIRFYLGLRKFSYDAVFVPFDDETRFMFFGSLLCGAKKICSHTVMKSKLSAFLKTALSVFIPKLVLVPFLPARHEIDLNLDLLQAAVDYPLNRDYKTYCDYGKSHGALENFGLVPGRYIVIQPGARSGAPTPKRWSLQNFKEFIAVFEERFPDLEIVAIGNQYDYDNYVAELLKSASNIKNTAGLTTLADAATIMQHAAVSVVHDSGAMHIGGAVEAKMVALYGPTDFSRTRPLGDRCTVLFSKQESFAEMFNLSSGEDALVEKYGENYCMDGILPETVLHAVETYVIP